MFFDDADGSPWAVQEVRGSVGDSPAWSGISARATSSLPDGPLQTELIGR
jgi:hypothetical protein